MRGSQPEGTVAHKSTSGPIHLSVIASSGNTDTIMQRLQGMLYPGLFFSLSVRDFSSQHPSHDKPTHSTKPEAFQRLLKTASAKWDPLKQTICLHTEQKNRQNDKNSVLWRHTHTHLTFGVLGEKIYILLVICANNMRMSLEHSAAGQSYNCLSEVGGRRNCWPAVKSKKRENTWQKLRHITSSENNWFCGDQVIWRKHSPRSTCSHKRQFRRPPLSTGNLGPWGECDNTF